MSTSFAKWKTYIGVAIKDPSWASRSGVTLVAPPASIGDFRKLGNFERVHRTVEALKALGLHSTDMPSRELRDDEIIAALMIGVWDGVAT